MIRSFLYYLRAFKFIGERKLYKYFLYSGLIGLLVFALCGYIVWTLNPILATWATALLPWDIAWLTTIGEWLSVGITGFFFVSIFKYLMLIFTAPLMSVLSERVEYELTGMRYKNNFAIQIISDLLRGARIALRNISRELLLTLVLMLLGLIPLFSIFSAILLVLVQGYYAGFGNYDFWAERHFNYRDTVDYMKERKGALTGNGIPYVFILAIPVLGAFIAPPLATIAATIEATEDDEERLDLE